MSVFVQTFFLVFPEISSFFWLYSKNSWSVQNFHAEFHCPKSCWIFLLGGSSQFGKWSRAMLSKPPKDRVLPFPNGLFMACQWGHPNHFLTGMILKVGGGLNHFLILIPPSLCRWSNRTTAHIFQSWVGVLPHQMETAKRGASWWFQTFVL